MSMRLRGLVQISNEHKATIIAFIMALVAFLTPYMFSYYYSVWDEYYVLQFVSLLWIHKSHTLPLFIVHYPLLLNNPINTFLRLLVVVGMYRYYMGKSTRRTAFLLCLISEGWQTLIMIFVNLLDHSPVFQIFYVPIPLLLITGVIFLALIKGPELPELWDKEATESEHEEFLRS